MKRHPTLAPIARQHFDGLLLARRIRAVRVEKYEFPGPSYGALPTFEEMREFFDTHLRPHFRAEEEVLFPGVRGALGEEAGCLDALLAEHREMERLIGTMSDRGTADEKRLRAMDSFAELLEKHIRTEDREVFPLIEARVPEDVLRALDPGIFDRIGDGRGEAGE